MAQVAPLVKSSPEVRKLTLFKIVFYIQIEHPIARVEPVYQTPFENSNNTRRVAPTRPIQATAPIPDMSFAAPPVENTASSEIEQPTVFIFMFCKEFLSIFLPMLLQDAVNPFV